MAIAADTTTVTGNQCVITQVLAAGASRTDIHVVNLSGQPVDFFAGTETIPFDRIDGAGANARLRLAGNPATLALSAVCEGAPLILRVTEYTA